MNINGKDYRANDVVRSYKPFAEDTDSKMLLVVVGRKLVLYDHVTHIDTQFDSFEAANDVAMERLDLYRANVLALEYEELLDLPGDRCLWKAEWSKVLRYTRAGGRCDVMRLSQNKFMNLGGILNVRGSGTVSLGIGWLSRIPLLNRRIRAAGGPRWSTT